MTDQFYYNVIPFKRYADESKYYSFEKVIKKKKFMNFITSARNMGKTYNAKKEIVLPNFYENGYRTLWLRRFYTQVEKEREESDGKAWWFGDALEEFASIYHMPTPDVVEKEKGIFYIGDKIIASMSSLTEAINMKGPQRKGVANVVLDEFIEKDYFRYITPAVGEPTDYWLKIVNSVLRDAAIPVGDMHAYLLSNAEALVNPYFSTFNFIKYIRSDTEWLIGEDNLLHIPRMSIALYNQLMETPQYRLMSKTSYGAVAIDNAFYDQNDVNIVPSLFPNSKQLFSLTISGVVVYFYAQDDEDEHYILASTSGSLNKKKDYTLLLTDIKHDWQRVVTRGIMDQLTISMNSNTMKFADVETRAILTDVIKNHYY